MSRFVTAFMIAGALGCAPSMSFFSSSSESKPDGHKDSAHRKEVIARAQVWQATDIGSMNLKAGPQGKGAFALGATVECSYMHKTLGGRTPKFACKQGEDDELKVKFGGDNGEVYAEAAATRLLWALGFGADHMYPVRVVCRGCPATLNGMIRSENETVFDPAVIERKMPGDPFSKTDEGWSWKELDAVDERVGGATRAQRDALKLLAVFIQHSDSKPEQQRLICVDEPPHDGTPACAHPFMLLNDLGVTFGRANKFNAEAKGSVNLSEWSHTPVWKNGNACVGNLPKSMTGTLNDPVISEEGRQFLANLLVRLSDAQLHDLFDVARVTLRLRAPDDVFSGFASVDAWVGAFKEKRDQIVSRRCG